MVTFSREEFFGMAGIANVDGAYTPVSLGKGAEVRDGSRSWIQSLRNIDFIDSNQLRAQAPERVYEADVVVPMQIQDAEGNNVMDMTPQKKYKAIVGEKTKQVYNIASNRYNPVQTSEVINCLAQSADDVGVQVFGTLREQTGKANVQAYFADADMTFDVGTKYSDPMMLGVRVYNSHCGDRGFGVEIIGVRYLCSNMMAFGETLGEASWSHLTKEKDVINAMNSVIGGCMTKVPKLMDKIEEMRNTELTLDEAECALWGISLNNVQIESITENYRALNPEMVVSGGKVKLWDVYNASTAYNTYANTGSNDFGRNTTLKNITRLMANPHLDRIIDTGFQRREAWEKAQEAKVYDLSKATLVVE